MNVRLVATTIMLGSAQLAFAAQQIEPSPPSQSEVQGWVQSTYPAILGSPAPLPEQFHFGFVVGQDHKILAHSVIVRPNNRPVSEDLQAMFPSQSLIGSPMGGVSRVPHGEGGQRLGVIWVVVPSAQ